MFVVPMPGHKLPTISPTPAYALNFADAMTSFINVIAIAVAKSLLQNIVFFSVIKMQPLT